MVAKGGGRFVSRPVWAFCRDAKCQREFSPERTAKAAAAELDGAAVAGLCVFPAEKNVAVQYGDACCLGLNVFSHGIDEVIVGLARYVEGVLS